MSSSDSEEDTEVGLAKWTRNKKPVLCPWVKANTEKYSFDINKVYQIFDFLLRKKQIQLSPNHNIPSADELKNKKYYKCHNSNSHSTNECKVFRQQIQSASGQGRIQLEESKKPTKIDQHPFPEANVNMVELGGKTKVLTSERARKSRLVDPKVQVLANCHTLKYSILGCECLLQCVYPSLGFLRIFQIFLENILFFCRTKPFTGKF
jgi:hypothetical protein